MENLPVTQQIIKYRKVNQNTLFDVELMFVNAFQCNVLIHLENMLAELKNQEAYVKSAKVFTILERILPRKIFKEQWRTFMLLITTECSQAYPYLYKYRLMKMRLVILR